MQEKKINLHADINNYLSSWDGSLRLGSKGENISYLFYSAILAVGWMQDGLYLNQF
ncbi:hypothetical protein [Mucilaginibacter lacusdianchii]|uniref:hypothetical protein n=1 Tax=Mucilaginibacter lacusdianchii TaxID=2684211 RepID=UPI00131AC860|nr:hypothetical protein [Mucilaginibacter sp. JXJ CY 39]